MHYRRKSFAPKFRGEEERLKGALLVFLALALFVVIVLAVSFPAERVAFGECVGVVRIDGELTTEGERATLFEMGKPSSRDIANLIRELNKKDNVKAVVIEINSPGGSVVASREIYEAVKELKKPKVAYIREIGASGAYYVAVGADKIIANPDALTGSIGVIAVFSDVSGLLEKVGVNFTAIKSGKHKDIGAFYRGLSEEEKEMLQSIVDEIYKEFVEVVRENRGEKLKGFESIADGRILTGRQALKYGLVDELGSYEDALREAAEMGNISYEEQPPTCEFYAEQSNPFAGMLGGFKITLMVNDGLRIEG